MKARLALFCIMGVLLIWSLWSFACAQVTQEWVARYNGPGNGWDESRSLAVDGDGNVYVTGYSLGSGIGLYDYATIKYNSAGVQQWVARYNGPGNGDDYACSLAVDSIGNVYVTGSSYGSGTGLSDYATIKYNTAGVQQWVVRYEGPGNGNDFASSLAVDGDGNVYVTGQSDGSGTGRDYTTVKYNTAGMQQWVARYNGPGNYTDCANHLALDGDGNVYVTGFSVGSGTGEDYATIKYNAAGVEQWVARYNGPGNSDDRAYSLAVDGNGNVYMTGSSYGSGTGDDYTTIKYDSAGVQQWVARYNGPGNGEDHARSLAMDGNGNLLVTGYSLVSGTYYDYATLKYDSAGQQQWTARYNGPGDSIDVAYSLALDGDGNVYATGGSYGSGTNRDYATIKYNAAGAQQWVVRYNGLGNGYDMALSLAEDDYGNVYVTGSSYGSGTTQDYATIKYSQNQAVDPWNVEAPLEFRLKGAVPNPFNPSTTLSYELPVASQVSLKVYDTSGRLVTALVNGFRQAGAHEVTFDGSELASGVYLVRLEAGEFTAVQKIVLLK